MINLQKNKCGGQDAHSALISDLKQVLAKYEVSESYADDLCGMIPHQVVVGDANVSSIEDELICQIQESTKSVYYRRRAKELSDKAFEEFVPEFVKQVNSRLEQIELRQFHVRGNNSSSSQSVFDIDNTHDYICCSSGRTSMSLWFINEGYEGLENPVLKPVRVQLHIGYEFRQSHRVNDFICHSVADVFRYGKAFFKAMCVGRDVTDKAVKWDLYETIHAEHKAIVTAYNESISEGK